MGMDSHSDDADRQLLRGYLDDLEAEQSLCGPYVEHMDAANAELFQKSQYFSAWSQSQESSMLILAGYNHISIGESAVHCWISPMAVYFNKLRTNPTDNLCALHFVGLRKNEELPDIVFSLLLQLLKSRPACLLNDEQRAELLAELQTHKRSARADVVESLQKIAIRTLNLLAAYNTVWLLVDRVHQCQREERSASSRLIEIFAYLVNSATLKARVGVLAIADGNYRRLDRSLSEIRGAKSRRVISHVASQ